MKLNFFKTDMNTNVISNNLSKISKFKKGFSLIECVVALAVIMIVSFAFHLTIDFANLSFNKSIAIGKGITYFENVVSIFEVNDFGTSDNISLVKFEENLTWAFERTLKKEFTDSNEYIYSFNTDVKGKVTENGKVKYQFIIKLNNNTINLNSKVFYNNSEIYKVKNDFTRVI